MHSNQFPLNYIKSTSSPSKSLANRNQLSWPQIILVFFVLTIMMLMPVLNHYRNIRVFSINDFYPNIVKLIDQEVIDTLQQADFKEGVLKLDEPFSFETERGLIAGGVDTSNEPIENRLIFKPTHFIISDETGDERVVHFSKDTSFDVRNKEALVQTLSKLYTKEYRVEMMVTLTMIIYGFIFVFSLFIVFVYAFLIQSMGDFSASSIRTYKESVNLVLNLSALPTITAVILGFIQFNILFMMGVQVVGLIVLLGYLYKQTRFEDQQ